MDEFRLEVQKCCKLVVVHVVYDYQVTQCDQLCGNLGLFAQYIDNFLKPMTDASGYPIWFENPADDNRYFPITLIARESICLKTL